MDIDAPSDILQLSIDDRGNLVGVSAAGVPGGPATVLVNGQAWATVPSYPLPGDAGRGFRCALPSVSLDTDGSYTASVTDVFGGTLASIKAPPRPDRANAHGVRAADVLALCDRPFMAIPYWSFDGAVLTVIGSHLPPSGDPSALSVEFGPGVAYEFQYPLESPGWGTHFWYWPNGSMSDFRLVVDLSSSIAGSDPFTFRFRYRDGPLADLPEPYGRVWIPQDLSAVVGLPTDPSQIDRVQIGSDRRSVTLTGFNHQKAIEAIFARHGVGRAQNPVLLDWGCGHGRVTRHFVRDWVGATVIGVDVDADNIAWASANVPGGSFVVSPLRPPCPLQNASVDAAFSISVMTHLAPDLQLAWLAELARVVRPRGILLMSFGGPAAVVWSSVWNDSAYLEAFARDGFHADQVDPALNGQIDEPGYYRIVAQSHGHVRRTWSEHFDVLEILPEAVGNLDVAVLRRRPGDF